MKKLGNFLSVSWSHYWHLVIFGILDFFIFFFIFRLLAISKTKILPVVSKPFHEYISVVELTVIDNFANLIFSQAEKNVLWLQISVNDLANSIEEI